MPRARVGEAQAPMAFSSSHSLYKWLKGKPSHRPGVRETEQANMKSWHKGKARDRRVLMQLGAFFLGHIHWQDSETRHQHLCLADTLIA